MVVNDAFEISTKGFGDTIDVTREVTRAVGLSGIGNGLVTVFCQGSTGTVTTIEFEPGVVRDLQQALERIVPSGIPYEHDKRWGDGNGFSHVRAALMKPSLSVPLADGKLLLGTWQQIVFVDFDNRSRRRNIIVQIIGE